MSDHLVLFGVGCFCLGLVAMTFVVKLMVTLDDRQDFKDYV